MISSGRIADFEQRGAGATAREIAQQPALWRSVADGADARRTKTETFLRPLLDRPDLRVVLAGAGTSAFIGDILASALGTKLSKRVDAVATTDIVSSPREVFAEDLPTLLVSFARSGDSPESIAAVEVAEQCLHEVHHLVITCNERGRLYRDHGSAERSLALLMPADADDQGFAMTSSFTCMALAAWLTLAPGAAGAGMVERLSGAGQQVLDAYEQHATRLAARGYQRVVYLGSGSLTGVARESALKMLELTAGRTVTFYDSALGFRHGPKSVLSDRTLAVVYLSNDPYTRRYDEDIAAELRATLGDDNVVVVAARASDKLGTRGLWHIDGLGDAEDAVLSLPFAICAQLLGLHFSLALGCTPDNPFPAGEVNRVVQGVTIHPLTA